MKKYILLLFIVLCWMPFAIKSQPRNLAFQEGEKLTYVISYSWGFIWIDVGEVVFTITSKEIRHKKYLVITGKGRTYPSWDHFFKVRDVYKTIVDAETGRPVYFFRKVREGDYYQDVTYRFDRKRLVAYSTYNTKAHPFYRDTIPITYDTYDLLSIIYRARCLDYSHYNKKHTRIPTDILIDNKLEHIGFFFEKRSIFSHDKVGRWKTIKFTAETLEGNDFKEGDIIHLWVSDDANLLPIWIEAPISVGSVKAYLKKASGLRHPQVARISRPE